MTFHGITGFVRRFVITQGVFVTDLVITRNVHNFFNIVIKRNVSFSRILL